jgi:uridine kinase
MNHRIVGLFDEEKKKNTVEYYDRALEEHIDQAIAHIEEVPELRLLGLTGPTCSGKTTAARKITTHLEQRGLRVHVVSVDDFYFDKEYLHRRVASDPDVEIDYDSEDTIDVDLLAEITESLTACRPTQMPRFNFGPGTREIGEYITPGKKDVFLFEGIQILYPKVNEILNNGHTYRSLAICPCSSIEIGGEVFSPNEIRLCRRIVRDYYRRDTSPEFTFYLWKSVRENEEKNIFPNMHLCHATIDSTMPYEMGMLKPYLIPLLRQISETSPYFEEAKALSLRFRDIQDISASYMTENSLYKEFIE